MPTIDTLKKRTDFLSVSKRGRKFVTKHMILLNARREDGGESARVGLTVTKKMGNAVVRNRIKRRLRAACREIMPEYARAGTDYVIIARASLYTIPYADITENLRFALSTIHKGARKKEMPDA